MNRRVQPAPWWAIFAFWGVGMAVQAAGLFLPLVDRDIGWSLRIGGQVLFLIGLLLFLVRVVPRRG